MPDPRVVNLRDFRTLMSGTNRLRLPRDVIRVDRATRWGNPIRIGETQAWIEAEDGTHIPFVHDVTREQAIAAYRYWLNGRLLIDPTFLDPLKGMRLACWCAPEPCHAEVIVEFIDRLVSEWKTAGA